MNTDKLSQSTKRALVFSFHSLGFGLRKSTVVFLAEGLAELGWRVDLVTVQLSLLSQIARVPRLTCVPRHLRNSWREHTPLISNFVWVPAIHPATSRFGFIDRLVTPLYRLYPYLLPEAIRQKARSADLIVIENSSATLLYPKLKRLSPNAKFVYCAIDSMEAIGMHPVIQEIENKTAADYDLFTSPSKILLEAYPRSVKKYFLPQGLNKGLFDLPIATPFEDVGPHAVVAGDMMFDRVSFEMMVRNFPKITFHAFGCVDLGDLDRYPNLIYHGEVPFETLRNYIVHADIGIAPYLDRPDVYYLCESSLKLVQYTYAGLPILAPYFCKAGRDHIKDYRPGEEDSIVGAIEEALRFDRRTVDKSSVKDWKDLAAGMLSGTGLLEEERDRVA
jgi:2-beta-glucuronyltransferase